MEFLRKLLEIMDADMPVPQMYGWFHLMFFGLTILSAVLLSHFFKKSDEKFIKRLLVITSLISIVLEIYKQINYTFGYSGPTITADYQWYAFPFQFCSTPMYIGLVAGLIKKGKLHDALCSYLATFAVFAGFCVMLYPPQVFISTIGINIQTMICHGLMIVVGIYLLASGYVKTQNKTMIGAISVFAVCIIIACVMNEVALLTGLLERETFNMFYISPHCEPSLPVYSLVQQVVPFPWCLVIYITAFSVAAYIILLIAKLIKYFFAKQNIEVNEVHPETKEEELVNV